MDITYLLQQPRTRCKEVHISKWFPQDYNEILKQPGTKFTEKLYQYMYNNPEHICPVCGKQTPFQNFISGYSKYCSVKCSANDEECTKLKKETILEKYGVDNISKLESIKQVKKDIMNERYGGFYNNRDKARKTMLEKYGVDNISKLESIKQVKKDIMNERYGGFYNNRDKATKTMLEKYGIKSTLALPEVRQKALETKRKRFLDINDDIIDYDGDLWIMKCPHPECQKCKEKTFKTPQGIYHDRKRDGYELCTNILPIQDIRVSNTSIEIFVKQILDEYGIKYEENVRNIIPPKELDIYIPDMHIAFECNGCYWHSDFRDHRPKRHYEKYKLCRDKGIQLITIWEDWTYNKSDILKSIIKTKLGLIENKIYARKCELVDISTQKTLVNNFLDVNHIQGHTVFEKCIGAYYCGELAAVMTFGHKRGCRGGAGKMPNEWELSRFCTKMDVIIPGIASRLLKKFEYEFKPEIIYSFSSNDISSGNLYKILGFEEEQTTIPYWYIEPKTLKRYHRTAFTKREMIRKQMASDSDNFTESEIMKKYHFYKIYDSGMTRWEKHP